MALQIPTTIKRLEIFLAYMEHKNMSKVSEALNVSALSVYRSIHSLEEDLGCILFKKKGRTLAPLKSADILYQQTLSSLSNLSRAIDNTKIAAGIMPEKIRVGSVNSMTIDLVPHLLENYNKRLPNVKLQFHSGSNSELIEKLNRSDLDVAIVYGDDTLEHQSNLTALKLFDDNLSYAIALNTTQPHPDDIPIQLSYLNKLPIMALQKGFGLRDTLDNLLTKTNSKIEIHSEFASIFSVSFALKSGDFATLLPSRFSAIAEQIGLSLYPLADGAQTTHSIYLLMNSACESNMAIRALTAECRMYSLNLLNS